MKSIAIYNIKGGVGKTATAVNLSYLAAQTGARTLLCDLDPQSSATYYFRVKPGIKSGVKGLVKGGEAIDLSIKGTDYDNLDLLPADFSFRNLDVTMKDTERSKKKLRHILEDFSDDYDLVFLDCAPNINLFTESIFELADYMVVPVIPTTLSVRTYQQLRDFFRENHYDTFKILPFFSMVEKRKKLHQVMIRELREHYAEILHTMIPYISEIERMGVNREPVLATNPRSRASKAYQKLWDEISRLL